MGIMLLQENIQPVSLKSLSGNLMEIVLVLWALHFLSLLTQRFLLALQAVWVQSQVSTIRRCCANGAVPFAQDFLAWGWQGALEATLTVQRWRLPNLQPPAA